MKKNYQELEMQLVVFITQDIVTLSGDEDENHNFGGLGSFVQ